MGKITGVVREMYTFTKKALAVGERSAKKLASASIRGAAKASQTAYQFLPDTIRQSYENAKRELRQPFGQTTKDTLELARQTVRTAVDYIRSEKNYWAFFKPRLWHALIVTSAFNIVPIMFAVICFCLIMYVLFYTMVIPIYGIYLTSATISFIIDIPLSIINAFLYAFNAIFQAIQAALAWVVNGLAKLFLEPIVIVINSIIGAVNTIVGWINFIVSHIPVIGGSISIGQIEPIEVPQISITMSTAPPIVFAYLAPPDNLAMTDDGGVDLWHFFDFKFLKPGPAYTGEYREYRVKNIGFFGGQLVIKMPKLREDAIAKGWLTSPRRAENITMTPVPDVTSVISAFEISISGTFNQIKQWVGNIAHDLQEDPGGTMLFGKSGNRLKEEDPHGDADEDGVPNAEDANPTNPFVKKDSDNDGIPDKDDKDPHNPEIKEDKRDIWQKIGDGLTYAGWFTYKLFKEISSFPTNIAKSLFGI